MMPASVRMSPSSETDAGGEELVERVHVVGDAGHQPPDGVVVEEGEREALQMLEHLRAHVVHDALADAR